MNKYFMFQNKNEVIILLKTDKWEDIYSVVYSISSYYIPGMVFFANANPHINLIPLQLSDSLSSFFDTNLLIEELNTTMPEIMY